jgi:outer membrane protein
MRKKLLTHSLALVTGLTATAAVHADNIGFRVGGYSWAQDYDGDIQTDDDTPIDIQRDLGFDDDSGTVLFVVLEHPVPLLPNILIQQTELEIDEANTLSRTISFDGIDFDVPTDGSTDITSNSDLSHTDATLYYEILDNWIHIDVGLTIRKFDGGINISSSIDSAEEEIDEVVPMLYLAAKFELPFTGSYAGASANAISVGDVSLIDYQINIGYETDFGLGIEVGLRELSLDYDDSGDQVDLSMGGAYAGIFYHF